jgi:hypothetical protein
MLSHLEKEGNYERRGCNVITAGPIVSVEAAGWAFGRRQSWLPPSALGLYWACQIFEKNLRAENSQQTGLHDWSRADSKDAGWCEMMHWAELKCHLPPGLAAQCC